MSDETTTSAPPPADGGYIGQPADRVDGPLKVTGAATYSYEYANARAAYGYIRGAAIGCGRIVEIDTRAAEQAPGVLLVLTHRNAPAQPDFGPPVGDPFGRPRPVMFSDRVRYHDEPVAFVVAETFEAARAAAGLIEIRYQEEPGDFAFLSRLSEAYDPGKTNAGFPSDSVIGDVDGAFTAAPVKVDETYTTPYQAHAPMEPHATLAAWSGRSLTLYTGAQIVSRQQGAIAATLRVAPEQVRIVSSYIGGGFGSKLIVHADAVCAALGARMLRRPVKVALTRQQIFANAGRREAMVHKVRLAADREARLTAVAHEVWSATSSFEEFTEQTAVFARSLYAAPNRLTRHRNVRIDAFRGEWMRSPGEATGMLAFESAMDELAEALGMDPVELRRRNEPEQDPEMKVPFSTRNLVACLDEGARRFGWERRKAEPGTVREGRTLVGCGMAAAIRPNYLGPGKAHLAIDSRGRVTARLDMTDIGTGTYTILTQVIAETLGVPLDTVTVKLGDSRFPVTSGSGGSWGAASTGTAVRDASLALREKIVAALGRHERSPFRGASAGEVVLAGGKVTVGERAEGLADLLAQIAPEGLEAEGAAVRGDTYKTHSQHAYGAHFVEVGVDCDTGEIRLRRMVSAIGAGRILNAKTARSQIIGGMTWGLGAALMEELLLDERTGNFVNHDLAGYHVAVHADVPELEVVFLEEFDDKANPLGAKGIGELGICGVGAAVANAVYNATGVRVREFPITLDKLLPGLPLVEV